MLPVEPISHYAQNDSHNCVHGNEVWSCQNLVVQPEAIVSPLAVTGAVQFQQRTPATGTQNTQLQLHIIASHIISQSALQLHVPRARAVPIARTVLLDTKEHFIHPNKFNVHYY
jgi:hypothetical protein